MESLKFNPNPSSLGLPSNEEQKKMRKKRRKKSPSNCRVKGYYMMNIMLKERLKTLPSHTVGLYQDYLMKAQ